MSRHCMQYIQSALHDTFCQNHTTHIFACTADHISGVPFSWLWRPHPPVNGSIAEFVSAAVGSQILYNCDPGFLPEGLTVSICSPNMSWSSNPADFICRKLRKHMHHTSTDTVSQLHSFALTEAQCQCLLLPLQPPVMTLYLPRKVPLEAILVQLKVQWQPSSVMRD